MNTKIVQYLGVDLDNAETVAMLNAEYKKSDYVAKLVKAKLKDLEALDKNIRHMVEGIMSEVAAELPHPYFELISNSKWLNANSIQRDVLYNAIEELGDVIFFNEGLKLFTKYTPQNNPAIDVSSIASIVIVINNKLGDEGMDLFNQEFINQGPVADILLIQHIAGLMTTLSKKNLVSPEKFSDEDLCKKLNLLIYCIDLCIEYMVVRIKSSVDEIYLSWSTNYDGLIEKPVIKLDSFLTFNDAKLNKRYVEGFTDTENVGRDYSKERVI